MPGLSRWSIAWREDCVVSTVAAFFAFESYRLRLQYFAAHSGFHVVTELDVVDKEGEVSLVFSEVRGDINVFCIADFMREGIDLLRHAGVIE